MSQNRFTNRDLSMRLDDVERQCNQRRQLKTFDSRQSSQSTAIALTEPANAPDMKLMENVVSFSP